MRSLPVISKASSADRGDVMYVIKSGKILVEEQDHLIDLATALGEDPPDLGEAGGPSTRKR